jgi:[calcium/calmodulin-dependent protein kinase] kinase
LLSELGAGSFAEVKLVHKMVDGKKRKFALKCFNKSLLIRKKHFKRVEGRMVFSTAFDLVLAEIAVMKKLAHPRLVKLYEVIDCTADDMLYLILEYCEMGAIMKFNEDTNLFYTTHTPNRDNHFSEEKARLYFGQMIEGIAFLHL